MYPLPVGFPDRSGRSHLRRARTAGCPENLDTSLFEPLGPLSEAQRAKSMIVMMFVYMYYFRSG